jgi:hypothetical protein
MQLLARRRDTFRQWLNPDKWENRTPAERRANG